MNPSNTTWSYDYDGASRLVQATGENATGAGTTWDYTYDAGGNRTRASETTGTVVSDWSTVYDASGLATSASNAVGGESVAYTYDAAGIGLSAADSTIGANDWGYTYDAYGRLTCAKSGATTCGTTAGPTRATYALDVFSRASSRTLNTTATTYVYRGTTEQVASATTSGTKTSYALSAGGSPFGQKVGTGAAGFYLRDPHGDTVGLVSTQGANLGTTAFDPWGRVLGTSGTQPVFGFQSDLTDALTKGVDAGTRWYEPGTGRFSSRDVVLGDPSHPVSLNQWVYGAANPVTMWDPTGMRFTTVGQGGGGGGGCGSTQPRCNEISEDFEASGWESPEATVWTSGGYTRNHPAPPPPEPRTSPVTVEAVLDVASSVTGIGGQLTYFWSRSLEEQADHIFASAGMGFLGNPATELWIAKSGLLRGAARAASRLGGAFNVAAGALTISKYYERNDGDIPETILDSGTELGWAATGAAEGGIAGFGTCLLFPLTAPFSPLCGLVGAAAGAQILGEFGEEVSAGNNV